MTAEEWGGGNIQLEGEMGPRGSGGVKLESGALTDSIDPLIFIL